MSVKVSIVVPVYKTEQYLRKCLDSLVNQTLKEIEILVVNDGSPDHSQSIIEEYEKAYPAVKGLMKPNGGLSDARNYGIAHASGEFIVFVDSDDWIEPDMCEQMYDKAVKDVLDIVVCDTFMDYPSHSYVLKADLGYTEDPVRAYIIAYPNAPARMIRAGLMKKHVFRKGIWYEDLDLMPTMAVYTSKIGFFNQPFYHYIQHAGSIMNQTGYNPKCEDIFTVLEDVSSAYETQGLAQNYHSELEYLYITHLQRSTVLRFVGLEGAQNGLKRIQKVMEEKYPNWSKNVYLKKSSWKFRLICLLGAWKQYWLIAILKKKV